MKAANPVFTFDEVFKPVNTEKSLKLRENQKVLTYVANASVRKNLAKVLFKQKFGVKPEKVNTSTKRLAISVRTKRVKREKIKVFKKFCFKLPNGFVEPN
jgi:ribosomal protein L23